MYWYAAPRRRRVASRAAWSALVSGKLPSIAAGRMGLSTSEVGGLIAGYAGE